MNRFEKWSEEKLLYRCVISAADIGDNIEDPYKRVYTPGFNLDNEFGIRINNNTILHGINSYKELIGLKIIGINFNVKDKFIKFSFEDSKSITVDMSDNGFNGPEAIIIQKDFEIMVIGDIGDIE